VLLAKVRTPPELNNKIKGALNEGLKSPELQASIAKLGLQTKSMTPREFADKLAVEARDWEAAVTESGVKID
jgi:tripartite-type tricarboxylate transporter receptor subunit TctC